MSSQTSKTKKKLKNSFPQQSYIKYIQTIQHQFSQLSLLHQKPQHQQSKKDQQKSKNKSQQDKESCQIQSLLAQSQQNEQIRRNEYKADKLSIYKQIHQQVNIIDTNASSEAKNRHQAQNIPIINRDEMISQLQHKNKRLNQQIQKIWQLIKVFNEPAIKQRRKLVQQQTNVQKLQKDLMNAYKQIKILDRQIVQYQNKQQKICHLVQKMKSYGKQIEQKGKMVQKLKKEVVQLNKAIKQEDKEINNIINHRNIGAQLSYTIKQHGTLLQIIKQRQQKEAKRLKVMKQQYQRIKVVERDLIENGISPKQLEDIKYKCIHGHKQRQLYQIVGYHHQEHLFASQKSQQAQSNPNFTDYNDHLKEIKLLQKLNKQHQKNIQLGQAQKVEYKARNDMLKSKFTNLDDQIRQLQSRYEELRVRNIENYRIRKNKMKTVEKIEMYSPRDNQSLTKDKFCRQKRNNKSQRQRFATQSSKKVNKQTPLPFLLPFSKNKQLRVKKQVYGERSIQCITFNDKYIIGSKHEGIRIKEVFVYYDKTNSVIGGLRAVYQGEIAGGEYICLQSKQFYEQKRLTSSDKFIKNINCNFESVFHRNVLVGIELQFNDKSKTSIGKETSYVNRLNDEQFVSIMSGSMSTISIQDKTYSIIQQLCFQIYNKTNSKKKK